MKLLGSLAVAGAALAVDVVIWTVTAAAVCTIYATYYLTNRIR